MRLTTEQYKQFLNNSIKQNKYHNKKVIQDDMVFDSQKENTRYNALKWLLKANEIRDLELQKEFILQEPFELNGKKYRAIKYVADFVYKDKDGNIIVEDAKGYRTEIYKLKKKMMAYKYGIEIKEV